MKKIIWIIDDDTINNLICIKTINRTGFEYKTESFTSAGEGFNRLRFANQNSPEELPDLIILDINMPVMNGWDFLEEFQKLKNSLKKEIKIVMLTSSLYVKDYKNALSYEEVSGYFTKPISVYKMEKIREHVLEGSSTFVGEE